MQNVLGGLDAAERASLMTDKSMSIEEIKALALPEQYIVSACHQLIERVTSALEAYDFGDAGRQIYEFLWDEYADWYLEISKTRMKDPVSAAVARKVLLYVWDRCLRLLHPFMPFLTEALWQQLPQKSQSIMITDWPKMVHFYPLQFIILFT
jgi:valyl-tRNA synthetase